MILRDEKTWDLLTPMDQGQRAFQEYWDRLNGNSCLMLKVFVV
jgi:hypothetical protein